jgi:hypothetical protein
MNTHTGPQAQEAVIPAGWLIRREGDEISVCAPQATPGMTYVKPGKGRLEARLLYALADALLTASTPPARVVSDSEVTDEMVEAAGAAFYKFRHINWDFESMRCAIRAALSTLQSGAEGKDGDSARLNALYRWFDSLKHSQAQTVADYMGLSHADVDNVGLFDLVGAYMENENTALQPGQGVG